jgi:hypothetical protein
VESSWNHETQQHGGEATGDTHDDLLDPFLDQSFDFSQLLEAANQEVREEIESRRSS